MDDPSIYCNGIDATTGEYLVSPIGVAELARLILGGPREDEAVSRWLVNLHEDTKPENKHLALIEGVEVRDLSQAGWGVIFADDADPAVREALAPLIEMRREQAGGDLPGGRFREFSGASGHHAGDSAHQFLARHGVGPGPVDPARGVPYYLLIVGDPERISYRFQYLLDVQFAVGRICFDDVESYRFYARSVVAAERGGAGAVAAGQAGAGGTVGVEAGAGGGGAAGAGEAAGGARGEVVGDGAPKVGLSLPRRCVFFGVENEGDRATSITASALTQPLAEWLSHTPSRSFGRADAATPAPAGWTVDPVFGAEATRPRLTKLLTEGPPPALLFTSSHGVGFPRDDPRQASHQGALLCAEWSSTKATSDIPERAAYFAAEDVPDDARLHGMVAFVLACHGAGTPRHDEFSFARQGVRREVAPKSFVSRLPQRLLAHPEGGALAVIGHVERAWISSFVWRSRPQRTVFEDLVRRLSSGQPIGAAMEPMNMRYTELAAMLTQMYEDAQFGGRPADEELVSLWTTHGDARNYVVLGDPAVRLAAAPTADAE